jgi:hypothetical protein
MGTSPSFDCFQSIVEVWGEIKFYNFLGSRVVIWGNVFFICSILTLYHRGIGSVIGLIFW